MNTFLVIIPLLLVIPCIILQIQAGEDQTDFSINQANFSNKSLIMKACANSPAKNQCIRFLKSAPASQKTSLKGLTFFTLKQVEDDASKTAAYMHDLLLDEDLLPVLRQALTDCDKHYKALVEIVEDSIDAAISKEYFELVKFVNAAIADADSCKQSLGMLGKDGIENSGSIHRRKKGLFVDVEGLKILLNIVLSITNAHGN